MSDEHVGLYEPTYTVRVTHKAGSGSQLDYMRLITYVPVENSTWGVIKTIYRK